MRVLFLTKAERGNTNEGLDLVFQDHEITSDDPLVYVADTIEWTIDGEEVLAVGVHLADGWQIMSVSQYIDLVEQRTHQKKEVEVDSFIEQMNHEPGHTAWHVADAVAWPLSKDAYAIGFIKAIDAGVATVYEARTLHKMWGQSDASKGMLHHIPLEQLHECPKYYRHLVRA